MTNHCYDYIAHTPPPESPKRAWNEAIGEKSEETTTIGRAGHVAAGVEVQPRMKVTRETNNTTRLLVDWNAGNLLIPHPKIPENKKIHTVVERDGGYAGMCGRLLWSGE